MGRWKRKKLYKQQASSSSDADSSDSPAARQGDNLQSASVQFTRKDKKVLLQYLVNYRKGAQAVADENKENMVEDVVSENVVIGAHCFPSLTMEAFRLPYLILPAGLTDSQRRSIHQLCVDGKKKTASLSCRYIEF